MIIEKVNVLELFGGVGAIRKALINENIAYNIADYVEIDKNAMKSYNALYNENFKPKSVVGYHAPDVKIDILMHGSPCQDFSRIGLKRGGVIGSGTRSSLLFETIRIVSEMSKKPKWIIWENVKGVLDKNMRDSFFYYLQELEKLGYESKYQVLNAMDFGVPQKRERIFVISYLGKNEFEFNNLEYFNTRDIKNYLEKNVSDLYEVRQKSMLGYLDGSIKNHSFNGRLKVIEDYAYTITTKQMRIPNSGIIDLKNGKYRYLTERECFRLMGFSDSDVDILEKTHPRRKNCTSSILYKEAGNTIVVDVLMSILREVRKIDKRNGGLYANK